MNERVTQALIRAAIIGVTALVGAWAGDAANIVNIGTGGDEAQSALVLGIIMAILQFVTKYLGGVTVPAPVTVGRAAAPGEARRPNALAV